MLSTYRGKDFDSVQGKHVNKKKECTCIQHQPPLLSIPKSNISRDKKRLADSSTSTSTGRTREGLESWLVLILMKEVWFVAIRPKKFALPTAFVSYGRISYTEQKQAKYQNKGMCS